jgi:hypothetical protein
MKEFQNIPSKLYEKTEDWIIKEKNLTKTKYGNFNEPKVKPRRIMSASVSNTQRNRYPSFTPNGNYHILNEDIRFDNKKEKVSMFDNYYHDKLIEKNLLPSQQEEMEKRKKEDLDFQFENHLRELRACNNIESQLNEQYESIKKAQLKANTPTIKEKGLILEKTNKNYIEENKQMVSNGQIPKKVRNNTSTEYQFHKEYGKTPRYLQNMKIEAEKQKEIDQLKKEESKYPKGTRLLSEEERVFTLNKLLESKKEIENLLSKLPITMASQAARNKQEELYKKLDEIDNAITTFSRKKVFVKVNS